MKKAVLTLVALALAALPAQVFAEAKPYASIRFKTMYVNVDDGSDTTDLDFALQDNTRLGVKFKTSDTISGRIEVGLQKDLSGIKLRKAYGVWNFGPGVLTVGQDYAPWDWTAAQRAGNDNDLGGYGSLSISRRAQMTARFDKGLYLTLINTSNDNADADDITFPIAGIGFDGKAGNTAFGFGAGYATYDNGTDDVDSYFAYAQVEQKLGAVALLAKAYYGQNLGDIKVKADKFAGGEDTTTYAGFIAVQGKMTDKVQYVAGIGYQNNDNDSYTNDNNQLTYYIDMPITISKGFRVIPTVTVFDGLDESDGSDGDDSLYVGAQWRFDL